MMVSEMATSSGSVVDPLKTAATDDAKHVAKSRPAPKVKARGLPRPVIPSSVNIDIAVDTEARFHQALSHCNKMAKVPFVDTKLQPEIRPHDIETAKMLNYCIRMLHADGWHPPTIVRAMAIRETDASGETMSMKGTMYRALRERRKEIEDSRAHKTEQRVRSHKVKGGARQRWHRSVEDDDDENDILDKSVETVSVKVQSTPEEHSKAPVCLLD